MRKKKKTGRMRGREGVAPGFLVDVILKKRGVPLANRNKRPAKIV